MQLSSNLIFLALIASGVHGAPVALTKRIAQVISASTAQWEQACLAAGGGEQCNPVSVTAFSTLLAAPGPCEQQNAADQMIDLAKQLNSDADMIRLTQIFVQQPRNTPSSESVQYCEQAPQNAELNGLFQCQYQGANPTTFVGGVAVGQAGTIPFGMTAPLSPAGSCPAHPSGPIADGSQLIDIVSDPGVSTTGSGTSTSGTATTAAVVAAVATSTPSASSNFQFQNGLDAQALNAQFATLTTSSSCSEGDQACINGGFAQCVSGKYVISSCGSTQQCFALPLVLSAGTTLTCDTEADAIARFAATGVTGGITGNGAVAATTKSQTTTKAAASTKTKAVVAAVATSTVSASSNFQFQNGLDAQALNAQFATLTTSSSCSEGDQACINGGFAQCVSGKYVISSCGSTQQCFALPLVLSAGTTLTCDTEADAIARFAATGVTGGITGNGAVAATTKSQTTAKAAGSTKTAAVVAVVAAVATSTASASSNFQFQNGLDAQALNAQFATLTASSSCSEGDQACINGGFAQCVSGKYVISSCGSTQQCFALPLVLSAGTTLTCDTEADAIARFAATGVTGGITGNGAVVATTKSQTTTKAAASTKTKAASTKTAAVVAAVATSTVSASSNFQFQNGLDAQALNAQFATLTASSSCSEGDQACINGGFAQCVSGKYVISSCGSTQQCFALPLVLSAGTTLTCDTEADAIARFAATGVTGGITGNGAVAATTKSQTTAKAAASTKTKAASTKTTAAAATTSSAAADFHLQNGQEAQALNAQFATLTASSACTTGQDACINGAFAQCANGKFVLNSCGADLACAALPLVNSAGTSIACTTPADALARIAATGATGGLTGA